MSEIPPNVPPDPGSHPGPFPSAPPPGPGSMPPIGNMPPAAAPPFGGAPPAYGSAPPYGAPPAYGAAPPYAAPSAYGVPPVGGPGYGYPQASPYVGFWARTGGWLIDWVILAVVINLISLPLNAAKVGRVNFHMTMNANGTTTIHHYHYSVLGGVIGVVITLLYGAILCGSSRGQTVGMMAVGARAVNAETGQPIGFAMALWRAVFEYLMFLLFVVPWVLDMLWPAWDARKQTWHDKVSHTVVIKRNPTML